MPSTKGQPGENLHRTGHAGRLTTCRQGDPHRSRLGFLIRDILTTRATFTRLRPDPTCHLSVQQSRSRSTVAWLGPAFFSKYLFFAGGGAAGHPSLILDARVASALRYRCRWESLHPGGPWLAVTYARYCTLTNCAGHLASRLSEHSHMLRFGVASGDTVRPTANRSAPRRLRGVGGRSQ